MTTLFYNGAVHTMDDQAPQAQAFVTQDGRFVYVGDRDGAQAYLAQHGPAHQEVDLGGKPVFPGLNDSHMHFIHFAKSLRSVNLTGVKSIEEIQARMRDGLGRRAPGDATWFEGEGWNQDYFESGEKRFPNKFDLDAVSPDVPMMIMRACFHIGVLNSAAMKAIGLNKDTAGQYGDLVGRLPDGEPDGIIKESLLDDTKAQISSLTLDIMKDIIVAAQEKALAQGLTSVQSDDVGYTPNADYNLLFQAFRELEEAGKLKIRLGEQCLLQKPELIEGFFDAGYGYGWGTDKCRVTCIKMLADGSLGARTAAMRAPYADDPSTKGLEMFTQDQLDALVLTAHRRGCPVAIHAIGDRAVEMALDAIEHAQRACPDQRPRHGIVHCQITDQALLDRFRALDVLAFVQPIFIDYDMNIVENRVGTGLTQTSYAWKTMIDLGIHASYGTDCPVEAFDTMPNLYTAVARKNLTGQDKRVFLPEQRVTMEQALKAYTVEGAYASGEEDRKGTISPGKLADFIVLSQDLLALDDVEDILKTKVLATYLDGKLVYQA